MGQHRGQSILEYAIIFSIVALAITGMQIYAKRKIQAVLQSATDQMDPLGIGREKLQTEGMRHEAGDLRNAEGSTTPGTVIDRQSTITTVTDQNVNTGDTLGGGAFRNIQNDASTTRGTSSSQVVTELR